MTKLQTVFVEMIARGQFPSRKSEEYLEAVPYTPADWAQEQLSRIRREVYGR